MEKEIQDGNRIINRFMSESKEEYSEESDFVESKVCGVDAESSLCLHSEMKYDSDWNWLMPVVEKIESSTEMVNVVIFKSKCLIRVFCSKEIEIIYTKFSEEKTRIEAVYNAVIEFIKWHNQK